MSVSTHQPADRVVARHDARGMARGDDRPTEPDQPANIPPTLVQAYPDKVHVAVIFRSTTLPAAPDTRAVE